MNIQTVSKVFLCFLLSLPRSGANSDILNEMAEYLIKGIDWDESPCDNFYQFACGGMVNESNAMGPDLVPKFQEIFEELTVHQNYTFSPYNKLKWYYNSCKQFACLTEEKRTKRILEKVQRIMGFQQFPILSKTWQNEYLDVFELEAKLNRIGIHVLIFTSPVDFPSLQPSSELQLQPNLPQLPGVFLNDPFCFLNNF